MADSSSKVRLKLLINTQTNRVLFAEAGKDFVDLLFHLFSLPINTVVKLLRQQGVVGCLGNLYESIEVLTENSNSVSSLASLSLVQGSREGYACPECAVSNYSDDNRAICPGCNRKMTHTITYVAPLPGLAPVSNQSGGDGGVAYLCPKCVHVSHYSDSQFAICPDCKNHMTLTMAYVAPPTKPSGEGGSVKTVFTYMVMDDLIVKRLKPISTISSLTLLNQFKVKDMDALKEMKVNIGMKEAVMLLKTSLHSNTVLTDVFVKGC